MPGIPELLIVLVIVLLIFGAGKLPAIGDALGRSIKNFKRSASGDNEIEVGKKGLAGGKPELESGDDEDYADVVGKKSARKKQPAGEE